MIEAHLGDLDSQRLDELIANFLARRDESGHLLAPDQLFNAVVLLTMDNAPSGEDREAILDILLRELEHR
jgi:hypothetical protein